MAISDKKKRYAVTLTPAIVTRFQGLCKDFGMPTNTMSNAIDDTLHGLCEMFQEAKDRGTMNITDIFRLMGRQVELIVEEEIKERRKQDEEITKPNSTKKKSALR